jgi:hypothetical protein
MIGKVAVRAITASSIHSPRRISCAISQREAKPLALLPLHPHEALLPFQQNTGEVLIVQGVQPEKINQPFAD